MGREERSAAPAQAAVPAPSLSTKEAGEALRELFFGVLPALPAGIHHVLGYSCWATAGLCHGAPQITAWGCPTPLGAAFPSSAPFHLMAIVSNLYGVCLVFKCIYFCMFAIFS